MNAARNVTDSEVIDVSDSKPAIDEATLDALMARIEDEGLELLGPDGVLTGLTSQIMNRALDAEMTNHLGYEKGDPDGTGSGNNRNGHSAKTVKTDAGSVPIKVPRDRNGEFEPGLVPKHARRIPGFNDMICGLLGRGMSTRDICAKMEETYGVEMSPGLVSDITDAIMPEVAEWRARTLDRMYPIIYVDAIIIKVRTDGRVTNRPCYIALGINLEGEKDVLGLWLGDGGEGAKYWLGVCTEKPEKQKPQADDLGSRSIRSNICSCRRGVSYPNSTGRERLDSSLTCCMTGPRYPWLEHHLEVVGTRTLTGFSAIWSPLMRSALLA